MEAFWELENFFFQKNPYLFCSWITAPPATADAAAVTQFYCWIMAAPDGDFTAVEQHQAPSVPTTTKKQKKKTDWVYLLLYQVTDDSFLWNVVNLSHSTGISCIHDLGWEEFNIFFLPAFYRTIHLWVLKINKQPMIHCKSSTISTRKRLWVPWILVLDSLTCRNDCVNQAQRWENVSESL